MATFAEISKDLEKEIAKEELLLEKGDNEEKAGAKRRLKLLNPLRERLKAENMRVKAEKTQQDIAKFAKKNPEAFAQMQQQMQPQQPMQPIGSEQAEEQAEGMNDNPTEEAGEGQMQFAKGGGLNFKSSGAYHNWLGYVYANNLNKPGGKPVSIAGHPHKVERMDNGGTLNDLGYLVGQYGPSLYNLAMSSQPIDYYTETQNPQMQSALSDISQASSDLTDVGRSIKNTPTPTYRTAKAGAAEVYKQNLANAANAVGPEKYYLQQAAGAMKANQLSKISEAEYNAQIAQAAQKQQQLAQLAQMRAGLGQTKAGLGEYDRAEVARTKDMMLRANAAQQAFNRQIAQDMSTIGQKRYSDKLGLANLDDINRMYGTTFTYVKYDPTTKQYILK